ncbi:MAG: hypothetical protein FJ030_00860 [Chloroflexi bacterium]|nr:hypothetical protein [Chloroflexota bacterium]
MIERVVAFGRMPLSRRSSLEVGLKHIVAMVALCYIVLAGGGLFANTYLLWQVVTLILGASLVISWLLWRGVAERAAWSVTGLEWGLLATILAAFASWAVSPDGRVSAARLLKLSGFLLIFLMAVDWLSAGWPRASIINALLTVSGLAMAAGLLEIYAYYASGQGTLLLGALYRPVTLLGHSNLLMNSANLALPYVIVVWRRAPRHGVRSSLLIWLIMYTVNTVFASSRGALAGLLSMLAGVAAIMIWRSHSSKREGWLPFLKRWIWLGLCAVAVLIGILVYQSSHPTHGGGLFATRFVFWKIAGQLAWESPWLGVGPGRFGFEVPRFVSLPPEFWPIHAHGIVAQTLAEFGLVGVGALAMLLVFLAHVGWQRVKAAPSDLRLETWASCFSLTGFVTHSSLDDPTHCLATMVPLMMVTALLMTAAPLPRSRFPIVALIVPFAVGLAFQIQWLMAYGSFEEARQLYSNGEVEQAYAKAQEAIRRDPTLAFYQMNAGWLSAELDDWQAAQRHFESAVATEGNLAISYTSLGLSRWHNGDRQAAYEALQRAVELAPLAPTIRLTAGQMAEVLGDEDGAHREYLAVLAQRPDWRDRDYWLQTELRRRALKDVPVVAATTTETIDEITQAIARGDVEQARDLIRAALSSASLPAPIIARVTLLSGDVEIEAGEIEAAMNDYRRALFALADSGLEGAGSTFGRTYSLGLYERQPLPMDVTDGLVVLDFDPRTDPPRFERLLIWSNTYDSCVASQQVKHAVLELDPQNALALSLICL